MPELSEKRSVERVAVSIEASCRHNNRVIPCKIVNLSPQGAGIIINIPLVPGDLLNIITGDQDIPAKVVHSNGNMSGLCFQQLTTEQINYINWLCRKKQVLSQEINKSKDIDRGKFVYTLEAKTPKDEGRLGMFLDFIRKYCSGYISDSALKKNSYQIEIYDNEESLKSFESLVKFLKAEDLILK